MSNINDSSSYFTKFTDLEDYRKKLMLSNSQNAFKGLCKTQFFIYLFTKHTELRCKDYTLRYIPTKEILLKDNWVDLSFILGHIFFKGIHIATKVIINGKMCILYNEFTEEMNDFLKDNITEYKRIYFYIKKLRRFCDSHFIGNYRIQVGIYDYQKTTFESIETKENCSILLENKDDMVKTKCNHIFCREALDEWLKNNNTCPLCRAELQASKELKLYYKNYGDLPVIETPTRFQCLLNLLS